ncbi:hypothetical protein DYU11_13695 [Fibrisoma montanum]|uniref:Uncharacterized protein n=1 Tax=Fibrisoma montanum TaxID=2305895 RepID=A0A418MCA0_9BACT|nr:hypothetical protein [Fibrisoma montanum]RIV24012.1 hypothetical protein DYU11_13695 [Fibrisoma montanum]
MTPTLRRAHRTIWLVLALPVGLVAALLAYRSPQQQEPVRPPLPGALPVLVRPARTDRLVLSLRQLADGTERQIGIRVR